MVTEALPMNELPSDLPPRTWHGWWLDRPKWLRIGCWAFGGVVLLHVALAVRIAVGLIEGNEIVELRQRGGHYFYAWEMFGWEACVDPYSHLENLIAGLMGKSGMNVVDISLTHATDADLRFICQHFPNVTTLTLCDADASSETYIELCVCRKLEVVQLYGSNIDDVGVSRFCELTRLSDLGLGGTLVTDACIPKLQSSPSLTDVDLCHTDVSRDAILAWRTHSKSGFPRIATEKNDNLPTAHASIEWSDGDQSDRFYGPLTWSVAGPLAISQSTTKYHRYNLLREQIHDLVDAMRCWSDGEYSVSLGIGMNQSEPVFFEIQDGRPSIDSFLFKMAVTKHIAIGKGPETQYP